MSLVLFGSQQLTDVMKNFLNRVARSILSAADAIARLTDDQSSDSRIAKKAINNDIREQQNCEGENTLSAEDVNHLQHDFIYTDPSIPELLPEPLFTENSQPITQPDDDASEPGVLADENWILFEDSSDLIQSDISLETNCSTGLGLDEIDSDESPAQCSDSRTINKASLISDLHLPIDSEAASPSGDNAQVPYAAGAYAQTQHLDFDISLNDLEKKSEATWQEGFKPYFSAAQPVIAFEDMEHHKEALYVFGPVQLSHEFDMGLADLEVRQQSTWYEPQNEIFTEKPNTSPINYGSSDADIYKSKLDSQANLLSQQVSPRNADIQGEQSPPDVPDDYWELHRIKLRPDDLLELKLRQSGALAWSLRCDPEDYIWALDGVGYFDNIWNVEGFFESMVDEAQDRYCEALYWSEDSGD